MIRSEAYVRWYRQACDAQDGDRPDLEDDLENAMAGRDAEDAAADEERKNPYHQKNGKFGFRPTPNLAAPHPAATTNPAAVAKTRVLKAKKAEPALTSYTGKLAKKHGGKQEGLDFRLKTEKSLARKIGNDVREGKGSVTPQEVADRMFDVNRYTTIFPPEKYAAGSQATLDAMRADGHTLRVKNFWNNPDNPYQGVNVQAIAPDGTPWELQFHTDVSFDVKEHQSHAVYEKLRVETNPTKIAQYNEQLNAIFAGIPIPPGVGDVA